MNVDKHMAEDWLGENGFLHGKKKILKTKEARGEKLSCMYNIHV